MTLVSSCQYVRNPSYAKWPFLSLRQKCWCIFFTQWNNVVVSEMRNYANLVSLRMFHETRLSNLKPCFSSERPSSSSPFPHQNRVLSLQEISFTVVYWNYFKYSFTDGLFCKAYFHKKWKHCVSNLSTYGQNLWPVLDVQLLIISMFGTQVGSMNQTWRDDLRPRVQSVEHSVSNNDFEFE